MPIDMNPSPHERLNLARESLRSAKADWYRTKLNQPDNAQKQTLLDDLEARAENAAAEIEKLEPEVDKLNKAAEAADAKAAKEAAAAEAKAEKEAKAAEAKAAKEAAKK